MEPTTNTPTHEHGPRQRRLETQKWPVDEQKSNQRCVLPWKDGQLFPGVQVNGSTISFTMNTPETSGLYPDDAVAVFRDLYAYYMTKFEDDHNKLILHALRTAIETADKRAVARHGYSGSEREKSYVPSYTKYEPTANVLKLVEGAIYFVEADSYSRYAITQEYSQSIISERKRSNHWKDVAVGHYCTIGELMGYPIVLEFWQTLINDKKIVFYNATSQLVDWQMVKDWMEKHFPVFKAGKRCDAHNFYHALSAAFSGDDE